MLLAGASTPEPAAIDSNSHVPVAPAARRSAAKAKDPSDSHELDAVSPGALVSGAEADSPSVWTTPVGVRSYTQDRTRATGRAAIRGMDGDV